MADEGMRQGMTVLREQQYHWPADCIAQALEELRHLRAVIQRFRRVVEELDEVEHVNGCTGPDCAACWVSTIEQVLDGGSHPVMHGRP